MVKPLNSLSQHALAAVANVYTDALLSVQLVASLIPSAGDRFEIGKLDTVNWGCPSKLCPRICLCFFTLMGHDGTLPLPENRPDFPRGYLGLARSLRLLGSTPDAREALLQAPSS